MFTAIKSCSEWINIFLGKSFGRCTQGSVLSPLLLLIYINDIPERIKSICKIFADDTSLFPVVKKDEFSQNNLNSNLKKLS